MLGLWYGVLDSSDLTFLPNSCIRASGMFCTKDLPPPIRLIKHVLPTDEVSAVLQTSVMSAAESVSQFVLRRLTMNELQSVSSVGLPELSLLGACYHSCFSLSTLTGSPGKEHLFSVLVPPEATLGSRAVVDFGTAQYRGKCPAAAV